MAGARDTALKTAPAFHIYLVGDPQESAFTKELAALGLECEQLKDPAEIVQPALILLGPGQNPPDSSASHSRTWFSRCR
jgi:hypothetical protein